MEQTGKMEDMTMGLDEFSSHPKMGSDAHLDMLVNTRAVVFDVGLFGKHLANSIDCLGWVRENLETLKTLHPGPMNCKQ